MPLGGIKWEVEEHNVIKEDDAPHVKVVKYVRHRHGHAKHLKKHFFPGLAGEAVSFLFAFAIAYMFIQGLGWFLATSTPLVVVESESMVHSGNWEQWHFNQNLNPTKYGFTGGMNVGDIILVKGDDTDDIVIGDVVVYTKYEPWGTGTRLGGEPIIHRVVGIVEIENKQLHTYGAVEYTNGNIVTPCSDNSAFSLPEIGSIYTTESIQNAYPDMDLENFRMFITKGDNNVIEDQCKTSEMIAFPLHEDLIIGKAKFDIPYLGYVKLGLVCATRYASGSVCSSRCWWPAEHPKCGR